MSTLPLDRRRDLQPSALATRPGAILLIVLGASVLLHGLLIFYTWNRPIGSVDPRLLQTERPPIRVKRATYDRIISEPVAAVGEQGTEEEPSLADLSQTLLEDVAPPGLDERFEADLQPRPLDEGLPEPATDLAVELPGFEIPEEVLNALPDAAPQELAYQSTADTAFGGGGGAEGEASGNAGNSGGGSGSAEAGELLRSAGLVAGTRPRPSALDRTLINDSPDLDQHLAEAPTSGPEIDFAGLALQDTTELVVPEHLDQDFDYFLSTWRDPEEPGKPGYFRVDVVARRSLHKLRAMPKDVIYLVDTSSSIPQDWVEEMSTGVQQALSSLNPGDRFNIVLFKDNPAFFSVDGTVPATPDNLAAAGRFLTTAESDGYTDVNAALSRLLTRDVAADRVYELILISDGQPTRGVLDTRGLINLITRDNDLVASIYGIGIGPRANRELLDFLAYRNKGYTVFAREKEDVASTIRNLASRLRYPLIKNLEVQFAGQGVSQVYPVHLPNIHQGERFSLYGRYRHEVPFVVQIRGNNAGRPVDFSFTRDPADAPRGEKQIAFDWAFWKLHHLYSELLRRGSTPAVMAQIEQIRKQYGLKTLY